MNFKQKQVTIGDTEYTLQKLPTREALKLRQEWLTNEYPTGVNDVEMCDRVLRHIVVSPKRKLDDFEEIGDLEDLIQECIKFQYLGKSKPSKDK